MKVIDMHCDTIMALYHDQKEGKYSELRTNDYNISIEKMEDYSLLDAALDRIAEFSWIIFTSVNGVRHFARRLREKGLDSRALAHAKIAAIGPVTRKDDSR